MDYLHLTIFVIIITSLYEVNGQSATTSNSTSVATGPPETCNTTGTYPAIACDQYWECVAVLWWYELVLQTCSTGLSYDTTTQNCTTNGTCASTTTITTTTVPTVTGPPETCTTTGRYSSTACNQFWECVSVLWWYELVLQTCGANQAYNSTSQACAANSTCIL